MRVFNLTDQAMHGKEPSPQIIKVEGKEIQPGSKAEVAKVDLAKVSGMIYSGKIAIDKVPDWYGKARRQARRSIAKESKVVSPRVRQEIPVVSEEEGEKDRWLSRD